ncbi:MAG: hypothetical protein NPIRA02_14760 [Nitrospirales bacterium]|nr:MAG: hypothetical protein NPIRA02_14760 [Nitrospirales bacterium]
MMGPLRITGIATDERNKVAAVGEIILPGGCVAFIKVNKGIPGLIFDGVAVTSVDPGRPAIATAAGIRGPVIFEEA